jgi:hypothetical protein
MTTKGDWPCLRRRQPKTGSHVALTRARDLLGQRACSKSGKSQGHHRTLPAQAGHNTHYRFMSINSN